MRIKNGFMYIYRFRRQYKRKQKSHSISDSVSETLWLYDLKQTLHLMKCHDIIPRDHYLPSALYSAYFPLLQIPDRELSA